MTLSDLLDILDGMNPSQLDQNITIKVGNEYILAKYIPRGNYFVEDLDNEE
jgi:hypothetical protein